MDERAERVSGFVEKQNRCEVILCSEIESISAVYCPFAKSMCKVLGLKLYGRARRARRARFRVCRQIVKYLDLPQALFSASCCLGCFFCPSLGNTP